MLLSADLSDDDVLTFSGQLPGWRVERIDGRIVLTPPTGWNTGRRRLLLARIVGAFAEREGYAAIDSSGGVRLPSGDLLSADAALVANERATLLATEEGVAAVVPDVVVELVSPRDRGRSAPREKCERWQNAGVGYVVLLDPFEKRETVWGAPPAHFPDLAPVLEL